MAAAALVLRYRSHAASTRLRYWKPIQTGIEADDDTASVRALAQCAPEELLDEGVRLKRPLSPHLAARLSGTYVDLSDLLRIAASQRESDRWVVEGAGGVLVPLDDLRLMIDLIARLALPVVVVARSSLGTINHTLLTLEALRSRSIRPAGVIMVGAANPDNREAIESYGKVPVIGQLPVIEPLTSAGLAQWATTELDREGRLAGSFE
ncbi:MAG: dethiobiotin synthase [Vicinamibacterales bacterium]